MILEILLQDVKQVLNPSPFETKDIPALALIEKQLYNSLSDSHGVIGDMCSHLLQAGGKRIRPLLVLYSGLAFSDGSDDLILSSVAAELIHMASLVHDDIIDHAPLRRNRASVNKVWGNHYSVLCGDYLFAKAFGLLSQNKLFLSLNNMVEAIENMCSGEILQAENKFNMQMNLPRYYEQIGKKTAIFLQCCCKSGAAIGGASETQIMDMGEYGLNLGFAFQIIDDILDFYGTKEIMGKPTGGEDLRQGIITLPILLLMKEENSVHTLNEIICKQTIETSDLETIKNLFNRYGVLDHCYAIAASHIGIAQKCLGSLPESSYKGSLYQLAELLKSSNNL